MTLRTVGLSLLFGWLAFVASFALWIFLPVHGHGSAPELGSLGVFILFGAIGSVVYAVDFAILLPFAAFFASDPRPKPIRPLPVGLLQGAGFALSLPIWFRAFGSLAWIYNAMYFAFFAFISGGVAGYALFFKRNLNPAEPGARANAE